MSQKANSFGHGNEQACAGYLKENTRRNSSCSPAARTLWGSSPPGSSRRAGGYSSVLRLTADEVSLPYSPVPKSSPSGTRLYLPRGTFWVRSAPVRSRTPHNSARVEGCVVMTRHRPAWLSIGVLCLCAAAAAIASAQNPPAKQPKPQPGQEEM